jgi:hypothetical protein
MEVLQTSALPLGYGASCERLMVPADQGAGKVGFKGELRELDGRNRVIFGLPVWLIRQRSPF